MNYPIGSDKNKSAQTLRKAAEDKLKENLALGDSIPVKRHHDKLVEELQIHEIELEMQNEELRLQMRRADTYARKYTDIYNNASSGQFTLSSIGEIIQLNAYGAQMLKKELSHLIFSRFGFFVSNSTKPIFNNFLDKVFASSTRESCEVILLTGEDSSAYAQIIGIKVGNGDECHITVNDISKVKKVKEKLKRILSVMNATLESIHNGILVVSNQGMVLKSNSKFAEMWNISDQKLNSGDDQVIMESIMGQLRDPLEFKAKIIELYANPEVESKDSITFLDGRIFERISKPMFIGNKIEGRVWSFLDITDRIWAEKANRLANWRLESIIEGTKVGTWEWNVQTGETIFNEEWASMIGYTLAELAPTTIKTWQELSHPKDLESSNELLDRHFAGELPYYNCECRIKHKQGHWIWILDRGRITTRTQEGKPLMMFGTHSDITARKLAEELLKVSENKAKALIDALPDMMFIVNREGVFVDFKSAKDDLAYQLESLIGKRNRDIMPVEFADMIDEKISLVTQSVEMQLFEYELEIPAKGTCEFEARMVQGQPDEFITIVRDISERKKAERHIRLKNEELQKLNAEKDKFFSIIAHDLRGPLGGILGIAEMMEEGIEDFTDDEKKVIMTHLVSSARNTFTLLENLLEWAQMDRGLSKFSPQKLDLNVMVTECRNIVTETAIKKRIELIVAIPNQQEVVADKNMVQTVIRNLLSNAIKFTPQGGKVTISAMPAENNMVVVSVKDTGIGMNDKMRSDLFRIDTNTKRPGTEGEHSTGLGLLLSKEFVSKLGGKIWVESEEFKGTVFSFTIPLAGQKGDGITDINVELTEKPVIKQSNLKILIAEDDEISARLIQVMVKEFNGEVFYAKTGLRAIEICRENPDIGLVLMNLAMPLMDGYTAAYEIRKFNKEVVIIAQTAFVRTLDREKALASGCDEYITKPILKDELVKLIRRHIKR